MLFALRFPNLESLCLEAAQLGMELAQEVVPASRSPPLSGHLRLAGAAAREWPVDPVRELPNGMNFRSIELDDFLGSFAQGIIDGCSRTVEDLTIVPDRDDTRRFLISSLAGGTVGSPFSYRTR